MTLTRSMASKILTDSSSVNGLLAPGYKFASESICLYIGNAGAEFTKTILSVHSGSWTPLRSPMDEKPLFENEKPCRERRCSNDDATDIQNFKTDP